MTPIRITGFAIVILALLAPAAPSIAEQPTICFTPGQDCQGLIEAELGKARRTIDVQAYSFTSAPIAKALLDAKSRGVAVRVILDKSQKTERYTVARLLSNAGIPVWIDDKVAIAHSKIMIIDGETVITGSFNFTKSAQERNAENVIVLRDAYVVTRYAANWDNRRRVSEPYNPP